MCGTREGELQRTAEHIAAISDSQGLFFAVAFLADSQYSNDDLQQLTKIMSDRRIGFPPKA